MSTNTRTAPFKLPHPGPYVAVITNHLDVTFSGTVEAVLQKGTFSDPDLQNHVYPLQYLSPFYGTTNLEWMGVKGNDPRDINHVKKSYGMWMIPPTVGTRVLCIFVDADPNQGYWLGCVQERWMNHMVPGIAASGNVAWGEGLQDYYDVDVVPVGEFLDNVNSTDNSITSQIYTNQERKPVHPFAERLRAQGLLEDAIRGVTSSSARRDIPSSVFGISTPGPVDPNSPKGKVGYDNSTNKDLNPGKQEVPTGRLSGHTFVMDDGDKYGANQLIRLRSSLGHQILLHDSMNVLYIANANGTAWLEMTASGKIDIYAADSVSIHSEGDFNFKADGDINLDAMFNINMKSRKGDLNINTNSYNLRALNDSRILIQGNASQYSGSLAVSIKGDYNLLAGQKLNMASKSDASLAVSGSYKIFAASKSQFGKPGTIPEVAKDAQNAKIIKDWYVPKVNPTGIWPFDRYQDGDTPSVAQRVPMHEPWSQHESKDPVRFSKGNTSNSNSPNRPIPISPSTGTPSPNASGSIGNANRSVALPPLDPADWTQDTAFLDKVKTLAKKLKLADWRDLLMVMWFETGATMHPAKPSDNSSAIGLIQFMAKTRQSLGVTREAMVKMTRVEQMDYVDAFFFKLGNKIIKLNGPVGFNDLYASVLWPDAVGRPDDYVIFNQLTQSVDKEYDKNKGLDADGNGTVTKAEAGNFVKNRAQSTIYRLFPNK